MSALPLKCRWCHWETPLYRRRGRRRISGYEVLAQHVDLHHQDIPEAAEALVMAQRHGAAVETDALNEDIRQTWGPFDALPHQSD